MNPQSNQKCFNQILKGGILIEVVLQFHQPKSQANKQYHAASYNTIEFLVTHVVLEIYKMHTITSNPFSLLADLILFNNTLLFVKCKITTILEVAVLSPQS